MRKGLIVLLVVIVLSLAAVVWQKQKTKEQTNNVQPVVKVISYQTQTNEEGEVGVSVTPLLFSKDASKFSVVLTTHSVELDYSLKEVSVLADDQKNEYRALSWDGGRGGHHLKGTLVFPAFAKNTKAVKLVIRGIEGVDRMFRWEVRKE